MSKIVIELDSDTSLEEILNHIGNIKILVKNRQYVLEQAEKLFLELINQGLILEVKAGRITHKNKNGEFIMLHDSVNKIFCFSHYRFYIKFNPLFDDNWKEIGEFLTSMAKKYLNVNEYTITFFN